MPQLSNAAAAKIIQAYSIEPLEIHQPEKGYRNQIIPFTSKENQQLCLILFKSEANTLTRVKSANLISNHLTDLGFPSRKSLLAKSNKSLIRLTYKQQDKLAGIYTYLPGKTISWEAYTQKHLKLLGQVMSLMHMKLMNLPSSLEGKVESTLPNELDNLERLRLSMIDYFSRASVKKAMLDKLQLQLDPVIFNQFKLLFFQLSQLPQQPLHMDLVRSNVLFDELGVKKIKQRKLESFSFDFPLEAGKWGDERYLTITGLIDFEKTSLGPRIVDIARTLAFLLVDCKYKSQRQVRKYFLHSGYRKRGSAPLTDLELLNPLVRFFLLHDFYKFLHHNPYQYLNKNEHFIRTRDLLLTTRLTEARSS